MKSAFSMQDEKTQSIIKTALNVLNGQEDQVAAAALTRALESFINAKSRHTENMLKLNDIGAAISRSEKERQVALEESNEAEQSWRSRFRALRGAITPEMKAEHIQRTANLGLAEEFTALIGELETDKTRTMLSACASGGTYVATHNTAFTTYAKNEWNAAIKDMSPALIRAFCLRLRELDMNGDETPKRTLIQELGDRIFHQSQFYSFNMDNEPVLSVLGLYRPALTGVDMKLYDSPVKRMMIAKELAEKAGKKKES
jgi:hypothetical protein